MDRLKIAALVTVLYVFRGASLILLIIFLLMLAYCEPNGSWYVEPGGL
jgi:hypothetical protein